MKQLVKNRVRWIIAKGKYFRKLTLFQKFVLSLTVTILLPVIIIGGISYARASHQIETLAGRLLDQVIDNENSQFNSLVDDIDNLTLQIATIPEVQQFIEKEQEDYYAKWDFQNWIQHSAFSQNTFFKIPVASGIVIIGDNGASYNIENISLQDNLAYLKYSELFDKRHEEIKGELSAQGSMQVFTTKLKEYANNQKDIYFITLARRVFQRSGYVTSGMIAVDIKAEDLIKQINKTSSNSDNLWIIDNNGMVIYHSNPVNVGKNAADLLSEKIGEAQEGYFKKKIDGKMEYFVYRTSKRTGWRVIAGVPMSELTAPTSNLRNVIFFTCIFAIPLALLVGYSFMRSIIKPVRKLQTAMKEAGKENWVTMEEDSYDDEIGMLIHTYNSMVRKISGLIDTVYKAEITKNKHELSVKKAEIQALQAQINPHFLYNTLGVINAYAVIADEEPIQKMVMALSAMFRYSVQNPLEHVRLKDEISHVENYLLIHQYRINKMPKIQWQVDGYVEHEVLRLVLQPLIENCFKHAFSDDIKPDSVIKIKAYEANEDFIIEVEDNGKGVPWDYKEDIFSEKPELLGIGLKNVHRRIRLEFGTNYGLKIFKGELNGTVVQIRMPIHNLA